MDIRKRFSDLFASVDWLENGDTDPCGADIWYLVSALRGPDSNEWKLKNRTTWRLRNAISPTFFASSARLEPDKPVPNEGRYDFCVRVEMELKTEFPTAQEHFLDHYSKACWAYWKIYGE